MTRRPSRALMLASTPTIAGVTTVPAANSRSPGCTSSPAGAPRRPTSTDVAIRTRSSPSRSVSSTMTTASAPAGIGAPVMIRIASPGCSTRSVAAPAAISSTTGSSTGQRHRPCRRPAPRTRRRRCCRTAGPARRRRPSAASTSPSAVARTPPRSAPSGGHVPITNAWASSSGVTDRHGTGRSGRVRGRLESVADVSPRLPAPPADGLRGHGGRRGRATTRGADTARGRTRPGRRRRPSSASASTT